MSAHDPTPEPVIRLRAVRKTFSRGTTSHTALERISLCAHAGEMYLLLGPSGSGKTTLLTLAAGLQRPTAGDVSLFGHSLCSYSAQELQNLRAERIGFVFQDFQLIESLSVSQNLALVLHFAGRSGDAARRRVMRLLGWFGLEHLASRRPERLSQGERQRVAIARALANDPILVIADEPTASLETAQAMRVIERLALCAHDEGRCVLVASHDLRLARFADRVGRLADGALIEAGDSPGRSLRKDPQAMVPVSSGEDAA